jgi:hypothetical protein
MTVCRPGGVARERRPDAHAVATLARMTQEHGRSFVHEPDGQAAELARLRDVERVALEFCERCERGEIRSVATYERFRAALAGGREVTPAGSELPHRAGSRAGTSPA